MKKLILIMSGTLSIYVHAETCRTECVDHGPGFGQTCETKCTKW